MTFQFDIFWCDHWFQYSWEGLVPLHCPTLNNSSNWLPFDNYLMKASEQCNIVRYHQIGDTTVADEGSSTEMKSAALRCGQSPTKRRVHDPTQEDDGRFAAVRHSDELTINASLCDVTESAALLLKLTCAECRWVEQQSISLQPHVHVKAARLRRQWSRSWSSTCMKFIVWRCDFSLHTDGITV